MNRNLQLLGYLTVTCAAFAAIRCGQGDESTSNPASSASATSTGSTSQTTGPTTSGGTAGSSATSSGAGGSTGAGGSDATTGSGGSSTTGAGGTAGSGGSGSGGATGTGGGGSGGSAGTGAGGAAGGGGAGGTGGMPGTSLHFAVYGDTRTDFMTHQQVVDQIAKLNPQLVLHSGDLWDGYSTDQFRSILTKNANIGSLLNGGLFVAARGNHETVADYNAFTPSLSRGVTGERFSFAYGNSFFVTLGMDPSGAATYLDGELKKPEATAARWRFVQSHYPVYSGGTTHGASGIPALEKLCDQYHVAVYWSGHDHIYERSHQVFGGQVADMGDALTLSKGTVYVVSGGGGAPLYGAAKITTTHTQQSTYNYVDVQADPNKLTIKAYKLDGSPLDAYSISQ
jgi:Calcineurin-like phosphoesterase